MKENKKIIIWGVLGFLFLIALDQITKYAAILSLKNRGSINVLPDIFELYYLENRGAAFGLFADRQWFFVMIALIMFAVTVYVYLVLPPGKHYRALRIVMLMIGAGAVGNMIDRIWRHYVVDFLYVSLIDFPVFNIADCYVVIGVCLLLVFIVTIYREDNFEFLNPRKEDSRHAGE